MIIEKATIIAYQNGIAEVQCLVKNGCGGCAVQSQCGSKALSGLAGEKNAPRFSIAVDEELQIGDEIKLGMTEHSLLKSVGLLYGLPLLTLLFSTILLSVLWEDELNITLGILLSTLLCFWYLKKALKKQHKNLSPIYLGRI